jgi:hypothetical protein
MDSTENDASNNSTVVPVAAVTFLLSSCLATIRGYTYRHTDGLGGGFMKYTVEMGSGDMIYIPSFIEIGSAIQELITDTQAHGQHSDHLN